MKELQIIKKHLPIGRVRPKIYRKETKFLVIHNVGVPNHNANIVYNWFLQCNSDTSKPVASCNFCVDLNGDIYEFIPHVEVSYTSGGLFYADFAKKHFVTPNKAINPHIYTVSVEVCHRESFEFNKSQIQSLQNLYLFLKTIYPDLDICRHYDITTKDCPKYYVDDTKWQELKSEIMKNA